MAGEQVAGQPNGTTSRIYSGDAQRRQAQPPSGGATEHVHNPIERDPETGRFLKPGIPGYLVSRARRVGLTDDDLGDIRDVEELRDIVRDREFEARIGQIFDPKRVANALREQPGNGTNLGTPDARQPLDLGLNDEEDGPRLKELLTKLRDHYENEIADLRKTVDALKGKTEQREAREAQTTDRAFERAFAKHPTIFGKGTAKDVTATKMNIRRAAAAFWGESGGNVESIGESIDKFVEEEFGQRPRRQQRQAPQYAEEEYDEEPNEELDEWEEGVLARPTQAGPREAPPGRDRATQNLKRRLPTVHGARDARTPRGIYLNHGSRAQGGERQR